MINSVSFYCILENGGIAYSKEFNDVDEIAYLLQDYLIGLVEKFGNESVCVTIMVEVNSNTLSRSSCVGNFVIGRGRFISVSPEFSRLVREFHND